MRRALYALALLPVLALTPACDGDGEDTTESFRGLDINIQLSQADGGDDDGTVIWEILEVSAQTTEIYDGPAILGQQLMTIEGNDIYDADGVKTCTVQAPYLSGMREVVSTATEEVLFTVDQNEVYVGEIDFKKITPAARRKLVDQVLVAFSGNEVWMGTYDLTVLESTGDLESASDGRKLLIAALIDGRCGSPGLD